MSVNTLSVAAYPGELVRVRVRMTPAADATGWVVRMTLCRAPAAYAGGPPPAPVVEDVGNGVFLFTLDTTGWAVGQYHFPVWRQTPDPRVLAEVYLTLLRC